MCIKISHTQTTVTHEIMFYRHLYTRFSRSCVHIAFICVGIRFFFQGSREKNNELIVVVRVLSPKNNRKRCTMETLDALITLLWPPLFLARSSPAMGFSHCEFAGRIKLSVTGAADD